MLQDSSSIEPDQRQPQESVLRTLDEWHRYALADLTGVVDPEPLVREVSAAIDHELWAQNAPQRPTGDQRRDQRVGEASEGRRGPPPSLAVETDRNGEGDATKTGESALPDGEPAIGMTRVVTPVGGDV